MPQITGKTKLLGVIGEPIEHSLSPVMHNAAIAEMGLDYIYLPFPIKTADLGVAIAGFAAMGLQGFSVTIPHKQAIISLLSEVSAIAKLTGAVKHRLAHRTGMEWYQYGCGRFCGTLASLEAGIGVKPPPSS
jgi:shikimate dehydrogenase